MVTLPQELQVQIYEFAGAVYAFDAKSFNVSMINEIFYAILQLSSTHTEEEIVRRLSPKFPVEQVQKELVSLKAGIQEGRLTCANLTSGNQEARGVRSMEQMKSLRLVDFRDTELLEKLSRADAYLLVHLEVEELSASPDLQLMVKWLAERQGRYRINLWMCDRDFVGIYKKALGLGLRNFDLRFERIQGSTGPTWSEEQIGEIRELLLEKISRHEEPVLAIIRDILRVFGFQLGRVHCAENCWARWICGNLLFGPEDQACTLIRLYAEVGVLYFIQYLSTDPSRLHALLAEDLSGKFTALERGRLQKNCFWANNLAIDQWEKLRKFRTTKGAELMFYLDCGEVQR